MNYTDGMRLATEDRYDEALERFQRAIAAAPDHDPSLFEAANILTELGRPEEALEHSARAAALDPSNNWYRAQQGRLLASLGRYDEALTIFEEMTKNRGKDFDPDGYRMLAMLYYQQGRTDDAVATLDSAELRTGPNEVLVEMKRGILLDADRVADAARVTEQYIAAAPYDESNRLALAEIYAYEGRDSLQAATLRQVLEINPGNIDALNALAEFYSSRGEAALFLSTLNQLFSLPEVPLATKMERMEALTRNETFYRAHFFEVGDLALTLVTRHAGNPEVAELYADHAIRGGDVEGALTMLKNQLSRPAPALSTFMKTIEIEAWQRRPDSVARYSDRALELFPSEVQIYMLRASAMQFMGRPKEARKTLARALPVAATDSLRSEVWGAIGNLWHEAGDNRKTYAAYNRALDFDPDNALVLNNYAYYLATEGRELDRALGMASRAVKLRENFSTYLDTYAWVLYKTGDYAGARRVMQQALPLDRDGNPELMFHYGDILWALGEEFMASVYWKRARDAGWEPADEIEERLARLE
ncbi:MAG: tetratricopeptide repeat protein [Alistipes sp.]|nr:tetratricopeptide repeat protein [Alistipes sp.]